jgi:hypothetical protein
MNDLSPASTELVSVADVWGMLARLNERKNAWEDRLAERVRHNPLDILVSLLLGSSLVFYLAELGQNPKVRTIWDALAFITTCASVGYVDIFAQTSTGKAVASLVMTFGPALCAQVFERPGEEPAREASQDLMIERLDAILAELKTIGQALEGRP